MPSGLFGVNAAWWAIVVLAFNLNALMTHLVLPEGWASQRLKAVSSVSRDASWGMPGGSSCGWPRDIPRVRLSIEVRSRILSLAPVPTG